jgi:hypothetical protein
MGGVLTSGTSIASQETEETKEYSKVMDIIVWGDCGSGRRK